MLRGFRPIQIPVDGGRRMDIPAGHPQFPRRDSPDIHNIVVWDGVCRKWPGMVPYTTVGLGAPVRFLARFELGGGTRHLVASDGRDLWSFDPGGPSWVNRTPTYTTGTTKFTNSSTTVEGTGTNWSSANCWVGMKIKNDADGTWYEVASLTDATHLELTAEYEGTTTGSDPYTLRQRRSAAGEYWMRGSVARDSINGDQIMVVNGVNAPLLWDGSAATFVEVGGSPPSSRFISTFHQQNLMVLARDASNLLRVQHSDAGDYTEWSDGLAASYDFEDSTARIVGIDGGHEYLYLFREDGIWRGFWEGTGIGISWSRISGIDGPVYPNSLVRLGGRGPHGDGGAREQVGVLRRRQRVRLRRRNDHADRGPGAAVGVWP